MDLNEFILKGKIEAYVLGLLNEQEYEELYRIALKYPVLKRELESIEDILESFAHANAKAPPPNLKEEIFNKIFGDRQVG